MERRLVIKRGLAEM